MCPILQVLAGAFTQEDADIDARPYGFPKGEKDEDFKGFHKIERALYRCVYANIARHSKLNISVRQASHVAWIASEQLCNCFLLHAVRTALYVSAISYWVHAQLA